MRVLVVHESMFGNTRDIARAVAEGLGSVAGVEVELAPVHEAGVDLDGIDLLVVGGPTHAFSMSRASTRADALDKGADATAASDPGIREWIERLEPTPGTAVAAFDTRVRHPRVPGSAARAARKHLRARGFKAVDPATTFWVDGMTGPLVEGEVDRARAWGADLGTVLVAHSVRPV
jgi:flavodoxin